MIYGLILCVFIGLVTFISFVLMCCGGFRIVKGLHENKPVKIAIIVTVVFGAIFSVVAFGWPYEFADILRNISQTRIIMNIFYLWAPITVIVFSLWARKKYELKMTFILSLGYGIIGLMPPLFQLIDSVWKLVTDPAPYERSGFALVSLFHKYSMQISIFSQLLLLLTIYSVFLHIKNNKPNHH